MEKLITFRSGNCRIAGVLHLPQRKDSAPGILMCHGFTGNKSETHFLFTRAARLFASLGMCVLRFDFRGSGDSEGLFEDVTVKTEIEDGIAAIDYLIGRPEVDRFRIGVMGFSMGAVIATFLASEKTAVRAICLWAPLAHPSLLTRKIMTGAIWRKLNQHGRAYLSGAGFVIGKPLVDSLGDVVPLAFARDFSGSAAIFHSEDDITVPLRHAIAYFKAFHNSTQARQLTIFSHGGHIFACEETENLLLTESAQFFKSALA